MRYIDASNVDNIRELIHSICMGNVDEVRLGGYDRFVSKGYEQVFSNLQPVFVICIGNIEVIRLGGVVFVELTDKLIHSLDVDEVRLGGLGRFVSKGYEQIFCNLQRVVVICIGNIEVIRLGGSFWWSLFVGVGLIGSDRFE